MHTSARSRTTLAACLALRRCPTTRQLEQKDAGRLPTSASHVVRGELGKRKPRMRLAEPISFRSGRPVDCHNSNLASFYVAVAPSIHARKFNPTDAKTFIAAADTKK